MAESKVLGGAVMAIATAYLITAAANYALGFAAEEGHIGAGSKEALKVIGDLMKTGSALIGCIVAFAKSVKEAGPMMQAAGGLGVAMLGMCASYFTQCVGALICIEEGW